MESKIMEKNMKKNLIYRNGPHKSSKLLAEKWGIHDSYQMKKYSKIEKLFFFFSELRNTYKIKGYDVYFFEGFSPALFSFLLKRKDNKLIVKGNDQLPLSFKKNILFKYLFKLSRAEYQIDGVIAVSQMVKEDYEEMFNIKKVIVCEGFIYRESNLLQGEVVDDNKDFIFIGSNGEIKGLDISIKAFLHIKENVKQFTDSVFYVIGGHKEYLKKMNFDIEQLEKNGVVLIEYTDDVIPYIRKARYQLHFARYEPNAVSIMECMTLGVIPIISTKTGNKTFVAEQCPALVLDSSEDQFLDNVIQTIAVIEGNYNDYKRRIIDNSKDHYSLESGVERWTQAYNEILND
jgi:glycosyltransferase involved in cell wall biosynthesis